MSGKPTLHEIEQARNSRWRPPGGVAMIGRGKRAGPVRRASLMRMFMNARPDHPLNPHPGLAAGFQPCRSRDRQVFFCAP